MRRGESGEAETSVVGTVGSFLLNSSAASPHTKGRGGARVVASPPAPPAFVAASVGGPRSRYSTAALGSTQAGGLEFGRGGFYEAAAEDTWQPEESERRERRRMLKELAAVAAARALERRGEARDGERAPRCSAGSPETTARGGAPFDRGRAAEVAPDDLREGNAAGDLSRRMASRSAAEELRLGRSYVGPKWADPPYAMPLRLAAAARLTGFPDVELIEALEEWPRCGGLPLLFSGARERTVEVPNSSKSYKRAAEAHALLQREYGEGGMLLFKERPPWRHWRTAPYFCIPKRLYGKPRPGKWRSIHNHSAGTEAEGSLNDFIFQDRKIVLGSVASFAEKALRVKRANPDEEVGLWLCDFARAFPQLSVRWCDVPLQGMRWFHPERPLPEYAARRPPTAEEERRDMVYLFPCGFTLGARSSMMWFCRIAALFNHLLHHPLTPVATPLPDPSKFATEFYVDDTAYACTRSVYAALKRRTFEVCALVGDPARLISWEKDAKDGAFRTVQTFLGVDVDVGAETLSIPAPRIEDGRRRLRAAVGRSYMLTSELRSLVGCLSFAARCAPRAGRTFLRRFWDSLRCDGRPRRWTRINRGLRCDMQFWLKLWEAIPHVHLVPSASEPEGDGLIFTDASGHVTGDDGEVLRAGGFGAVNLELGEYFCGDWPEEAASLDINSLECLAVLMSALRWGSSWKGRKIVLRCDNQSSCAVLRSGVARDAALMVPIRHLHFDSIRHSYELHVRHIAGVENELADLSSRGLFEKFEETARAKGVTLTRVGVPVSVSDMLNRMKQARTARAAAAADRGR